MSDLDVAVPQEAYDAIYGEEVEVVRWIDIFESDGVTPFLEEVGATQGRITVSMANDTRRTASFTFNDPDLHISHIDGLWYDKVIKPHYGFQLPDYGLWSVPCGVFVIDNIDQPDFPSDISVTCRDMSKKLIRDEFGQTVSFVKGSRLVDTIKTIATNGGINLFNLPSVPDTLGKDFVFESGMTRMRAIHDLCIAYGYEVYFDQVGYLTVKEISDPATSPLDFSFQTGEPYGILVDYKKSANDTRIYNHIVVTGEASDGLPVVAEAENNNPSSVTRIDRIGRRTYRYTSSWISTVEQAQNVADKFIALHALESFEVRMSSVVVPWLEAGRVVEFVDPNPNHGQPTRFLLHNFTIPWNLSETMASECRRVELYK